MRPGSLVRFESLATRGRYFTGRVVQADKTHAVVEDAQDNKRWKPTIIKLTRLEYVKPTGRFR